jgi:hypothetical protein
MHDPLQHNTAYQFGKGDASYTISFKTQGPTIDKLYYAAGGRALEYKFELSSTFLVCTLP